MNPTSFVSRIALSHVYELIKMNNNMSRSHNKFISTNETGSDQLTGTYHKTQPIKE